MSILSLVNFLHLFWTRQEEGEVQPPDNTFNATLTNLPQKWKTKMLSSLGTGETLPTGHPAPLLHPAQDLQCCKYWWSNSVSSKDHPHPEQTFMNEVLPVAPEELRGATDFLRETPVRTNPESPAMAQPDTPGQKLEFPGEIQAPGWVLLAPLNGHYKPQTTKGQCSCSSAKSLGDIPLPGQQGLKLLLPSHSAGLGMDISNW